MWRKGLTRRRDHAQDGEPINKCYKLNTLSKQNNARSVRPIHFQLLEVDLQMAGWSKFSDCPGLYEMHWHTLTSSLVIVRGQLEWLQTHLWVSHRKVMTHSNAVSGDLSSLGFSLLNLCVGKTYCTKESYRYGAPPVFRAKTNKHKGVYILCAYVYIYIYIHTHPLSLYIPIFTPSTRSEHTETFMTILNFSNYKGGHNPFYIFLSTETANVPVRRFAHTWDACKPT